MRYTEYVSSPLAAPRGKYGAPSFYSTAIEDADSDQTILEAEAFVTLATRDVTDMDVLYDALDLVTVIDEDNYHEQLRQWRTFARVIAELARSFIQDHNDHNGYLTLSPQFDSVYKELSGHDDKDVIVKSQLSSLVAAMIQNHTFDVDTTKDILVAIVLHELHDKYVMYSVLHNTVRQWLYDTGVYEHNVHHFIVHDIVDYITAYLIAVDDKPLSFLDIQPVINEDTVNSVMRAVDDDGFYFWITPYQYENLNTEGNLGTVLNSFLCSTHDDDDYDSVTEDPYLAELVPLLRWLALNNNINPRDMYTRAFLAHSTHPFITALRQEAEEVYNRPAILTFLSRITLTQLIEMYHSTDDAPTTIYLPPATPLGYFDPALGAGGTFEIKHKGFTLDVTADMLHDRFGVFHLDGEFNDYGYSPFDVYGEMDFEPIVIPESN